VTQESPAKVKVPKINQVAIAVWDIEQVTHNFWNILGIGPWETYNWEPPLIYDRKYYGKPSWAREKISLCRVGPVQIELVQPVAGKSLYRDFLNEYGEGLHHLNFLVEDIDKTSSLLAAQGFPSILSGRYGEKCGFSYHPIPPLHTLWEPVCVGPKSIQPIWLPDTSQPSPAKVKVTAVNQIAIAVWDLETVARNFWNILGIGPWEVYDWEPPMIYDRKYYGKPSWARERIALCRMGGGVQLELVQPVEGESLYRDFLNKHGEGLHHLNFLVENIDETMTQLTEEGYPSILSGRYGEKCGFSYHPIPPLRTLWEPVCAGPKSIQPTWIPQPPASA